jgi:putative hydrolase of the HAD superfamily
MDVLDKFIDSQSAKRGSLGSKKKSILDGSKKYKVIAFDLGDTLVSNSNVLIAERKLCKEIGEDMIFHLVGNGQIDTDTSAEEIIFRARCFREITSNQEMLIREWISPQESGKLFSDALEVLTYLKEKSYKIGIISNSPPTKKNALREYGIEHLVDEAVFSFQCGYRKPDRRIFEYFCQKIKANPSEVLMIGDSLKNDIFGARWAGMDALLLDKDELDYEFRGANLLELKSILEWRCL